MKIKKLTMLSILLTLFVGIAFGRTETNARVYPYIIAYTEQVVSSKCLKEENCMYVDVGKSVLIPRNNIFLIKVNNKDYEVRKLVSAVRDKTENKKDKFVG